MCGLVGVLSNKGYLDASNRKAFFIQSLYADALRGFDSTGFFLSPKKKKDDCVIVKRAFAAPDFLDMNSVTSALNDFGRYKYAVGHNRAATRGKVAHKTAHPFNHGNITLVHNGTLRSTLNLPDHLDFSVDSEMIAHAFDKETPEDIIPELQGAFALIWHNTKDDTISIVRNEERPLAFATVKGESDILLGSEYKMIDWVAHRNGIEVDQIFTLSKGKILTFNPDKPSEYTSKEVKLQKKYIAPANNYSNNYGNRYNNKYQKALPHDTSSFFRGEKLLKKLELKVDCWVDFIPLSFDTYSKNPPKPVYGYLTGLLENRKEKHELRAVGLREDEWSWTANPKKEEGETRLVAQIRGARFDNTSKQIIVELHNVEYFFEDEEDKEEDEKVKQIETKKKEPSSRDSNEKIPGPHDAKLTLKEWDLATNKGCALCTCNIEVEDALRIGWTTDKQPICSSCMHAPGFSSIFSH